MLGVEGALPVSYTHLRAANQAEADEANLFSHGDSFLSVKSNTKTV